jgi:hypothetical protein
MFSLIRRFPYTRSVNSPALLGCIERPGLRLLLGERWLGLFVLIDNKRLWLSSLSFFLFCLCVDQAGKRGQVRRHDEFELKVDIFCV